MQLMLMYVDLVVCVVVCVVRGARVVVKILVNCNVMHMFKKDVIWKTY